MTKFSRFGLLAVAAVFVATLSGCGKDKEQQAVSAADAGILTFIPADSPYVFATLQSAPEELSDKLEPHIDSLLDAYKIVIREAMESGSSELPEGSEERAMFEKTMPALEEFMEILSVDGMKSVGIDRDSRFAFYGNGLLPVMRIGLSDPKLFDVAIERIEKEAGESMAVAKAGGETYRYIDADEVRIIVETIGDYAVFTGVPSTFDESQVARAIGVELPKQNIGDTGELTKIAKEFGYTNHMIGFINSERLASTFVDTPKGLDADLLALADFDPASLSDVCREEIREMAAVVPRIVTGYNSIDDEKLDSSMVIELRDDIAAGLAKMPTAVPGLGRDSGGLFSIGMSLNVKEMRDFYSARLDAMESDPYECEFFQDLQAGVAAGRAALQQPVPPMVYDIRGFVAVVDDITGMDLASQKPPEDIDASFVLAVDNAPALLQLGAMFSPEIAMLDLQPDGKAVEFTPRQLGDVVDSAYIALDQDALALSIGDGAQSDVTDLLGASSASPAPFMSIAMDAERYYSFIGQAMMVGDDGDNDLSPEGMQAMSDIMTTIGEIYERMVMDVHFTSRGIEVDSVVTLGD